MTNLSFDPDNTLAGGLFGMTPKEAIRLGIRLCEAVERAVGAEGVHGGVWPGNITVADDQVALGPESRSGIGEMSPDALEFVSPEQFWVGAGSPASDVYSIGLILYTALNRGVKPYFRSDGTGTPEERADAMQSRMKGENLPYPATAGRALGDVVLKAAAYQAQDRYQTPGLLRSALAALPEGSDLPSTAPVVPLTESERRSAPNYKVDKSFEDEPQPAGKARRSGRKGKRLDRLAALTLDQEDGGKTEQVVRTLVSGQGQEDASTPPPPPEPAPEPPRKTRREKGEVDEDMDAEEFREGKNDRISLWKVALMAVVAVAVVAAILLLLKGCQSGGLGGIFGPKPTPEETEEPTETQDLIRPPVPDTPIPGLETPEPEETPEETAEPTPEVTEPKEPEYELFIADVSWTQARDLCEQRGGHLATVRSQEDFDKMVALAEENGVRFLWLGAFRDPDSTTWYYVTGERAEFFVWDAGEPSFMDGDGTREDYLLLWFRGGRWCCNDQRNDPVSVLPGTYSGKTAYVCEYD